MRIMLACRNGRNPPSSVGKNDGCLYASTLRRMTIRRFYTGRP